MKRWARELTWPSEEPQLENVGSEPAAVQGAGAKLADPVPCQYGVSDCCIPMYTFFALFKLY